MYMLQRNWENCKENKGNNKAQRRSQVNTLTIIELLIFFVTGRVKDVCITEKRKNKKIYMVKLCSKPRNSLSVVFMKIHGLIFYIFFCN